MTETAVPATVRGARSWHGLTAALAWFAVVFQLILLFRGGRVLEEVAVPPLGVRLVRFISYFTILSNLLVALTATPLALDRPTGSRLWRVLRLNAVVSIAVTGLIHWFFLRPLLHLHGADYLADKLLHVVVPLVAVVGWLVFGPRGRIDRSLLLPSLIYPLGWLAVTLVRGGITGWYPYPFLDVGLHGYGTVLVNCLLVAILLLALSAGAVALDGRLPGRVEVSGRDGTRPNTSTG